MSLVNPNSSFLTPKEGLCWLKLLVNLALGVKYSLGPYLLLIHFLPVAMKVFQNIIGCRVYLKKGIVHPKNTLW